MRRGLIGRHNETAHIILYTNRCADCGKCAKSCQNGVLGRVDIFVHKHAHVERADLCVGCLKCAKVCPQKAIVSVKKQMQQSRLQAVD